MRREKRERERHEVVTRVYEFLRDRLPHYQWGVVEVASESGRHHLAFGGSHTAIERFVCLTIDQRMIDCAAAAPHDLIRRLEIAGVELRLDRSDDDLPVSLELD
jgi:transketolase C-terminal domain/subunit